MKHEHMIKDVLPGSIADELGIEAGDKLISINNNEIEDVFDYHFYVNDEELVLLIEKPNGEEWELEIEKDYEEDLGIEFEQGLMDEYRSCHNKCMFCFIDHDIERIVRYHLEPINISFQTTNPELRCKMLHNRFAGDALKKVDTLYESGIQMNGHNLY